MNCPNCQAEVAKNSLFCARCGERLESSEQNIGARISARGKTDSGSTSSGDRFRGQLSAPSAPDDDDREIELWQGGFSPKAMIRWWFGSGLLTIVLVVGLVFLWENLYMLISIPAAIALAWLWPACVLIYRRMAIRYRLTSQRFIHEHGVITRVTDRIEVIDIDDLRHRQTLIDRMVGVGSITIKSGDISHPVLVLHGIDDVQRIYDLIDNTRRRERVRRGIHIATAGRGSGIGT